MKTFHSSHAPALFAALALSVSLAAHAADVSVDFELTQWSSAFAEHSTLTATGGFTTWQGGVVGWDGASPGSTTLPLAGGDQPFVQTSSSGVQYSAPLQHVVDLPESTTSVTFDDRIGYQFGDYRYAEFPNSVGAPNLLSFAAAAPSSVSIGEEFLLGTFTVSNGSWHSELNGAPDPVMVDFSITSVSSDPAFSNFVFSGTFLYSTFAVPNGSELENADSFSILGRPDLGAARVIEGQTGTFQLMGSIGSLHLNGFANATGGVVLTSSVGPIPEPETYALMLAGLACVGWGVRRARRPA